MCQQSIPVLQDRSSTQGFVRCQEWTQAKQYLCCVFFLKAQQTSKYMIIRYAHSNEIILAGVSKRDTLWYAWYILSCAIKPQAPTTEAQQSI